MAATGPKALTAGRPCGLSQCYLYLFYSPGRTAKVLLLLLFICLSNAKLHGLRSLWQILFHVGVASLSSHQTLTRQLRERQSGCGV